MVKKRARKTRVKNKSTRAKNKISLVVRQLLLFFGLFLIFFVLLKLSNKLFWLNFFQIMSIIFGFISVGFLIAFLVLWIMKIVKKK
jgi:hypothetical protein